MNSEARKVRDQALGTPSHEDARSEEEGYPLDLGHRRTVGSETPLPIAHSGFGG
jgi:hypothetical protein